MQRCKRLLSLRTVWQIAGYFLFQGLAQFFDPLILPMSHFLHHTGGYRWLQPSTDVSPDSTGSLPLPCLMGAWCSPASWRSRTIGPMVPQWGRGIGYMRVEELADRVRKCQYADSVWGYSFWNICMPDVSRISLSRDNNGGHRDCARKLMHQGKRAF